MQAANVRCHKQVLERLTSKLTSKLVLEPKRLTILTNQSCWYNKEADVAAIAKFRKVELKIRLKTFILHTSFGCHKFPRVDMLFDARLLA